MESEFRLIARSESNKFWNMTNLHIQSVRSPYDDPRVAAAAIGALSRADAMGLLPQQITCLNDLAMEGLEKVMLEAGIGQTFLSGLHRVQFSDPAQLTALLERINEALEESPAPAYEWRTLHKALELDLLAELLGISQSSVRRYLSGSRPTPDTVAARLHFLAFIVGDLSGAYNDIGVRRWFARPRKRLDGHSPAPFLAGRWLPDDEGPLRVRELARSLVSSVAT